MTTQLPDGKELANGWRRFTFPETEQNVLRPSGKRVDEGMHCGLADLDGTRKTKNSKQPKRELPVEPRRVAVAIAALVGVDDVYIKFFADNGTSYIAVRIASDIDEVAAVVLLHEIKRLMRSLDA